MAFEWTDENGERLRLQDGRVEIWFRGGEDEAAGWVRATQQEALTGLHIAANAVEVYRKALEPFASAAIDRLAPALEYIRPQDQEMDLLVWLDRQERDALREACRLMGIEIAPDLGDAP